MRAAVIDIETTALEAVGAGFLLCAVVKPYNRLPQVYRIDEFRGDTPGKETRLLTAVLAAVREYDLVIGHNIEKFDWRFLKSRAYRLGLQPGPDPFGYDTCKAWRRVGMLTVQNGFGKPSAGLAHVVDFLRIKQEKTKVMPGEWWEAVWEKRAKRTEKLNDIVAHCIFDVRMNERAYEAILPLDAHATIKRLR